MPPEGFKDLPRDVGSQQAEQDIDHFILKNSIDKMDDLPPIVLDQGTGFVKVGYAGQSECASLKPSKAGPGCAHVLNLTLLRL